MALDLGLRHPCHGLIHGPGHGPIHGSFPVPA